MSDNATFTMSFRVREDGSLVLAEKKIRGAGKATDDLSNSQKRAGKSSDELTYKLNQGAAASASAGRNLSKMAQGIGSGPNGLVGAYATLAANAFAVSAAFTALRSAQQAELVLRGLEEQGARTGRTLTVAADSLREVVGFGISAQDSMKATAQFTSAGFSTTELEKLGKVAQESSLALGRNLPDALDRLIKGTTKLEPELIDELGIMTKLGDSTAAYAVKNNKTVSSLTQFERRQAFLNSVIAEGTLKFGGLSEAIETNPYDKLAGTFNDLTVKVFGFANSQLGLINVASFLSNNMLALGGVLVLFASTIQKTLLGSLSDLAARSVAAAQATRVMAAEARNATKAKMDQAKAAQLASLEEARQIQLHEKTTKSVKDRAQALREGKLSQEEFNKVIKANKKSLETHERLLTKDKDAGKDTTSREAIISGLRAQGVELENLRKRELDYTNNVTNTQGAAQRSLRAEMALVSRARAQDSVASAIQSASNLSLTGVIVGVTRATRQYAIALAIESREKIAAARASQYLAAQQVVLIQSYNYLKVAIFGTIAYLKALAAGLLRIVPFIGIVMLAVDGLKSAWDFIANKLWPNTMKAQKELSSVMEEHTKVIETQNKAVEYYTKILNSEASAASRATEATLNKANSLIELSTSYNAVVDAIEAKIKAEELDSKGSNSSSIQTQKSFDEQMQLARAKQWGVSPDSLTIELGAKAIEQSNSRLASAFRSNDADAQAFVSSLYILEKRLGKEGLTKALDEAAGGAKRFQNATVLDQYKALAKVSKDVAASQILIKDSTESLTDAFKTGELAANKFFTDAIGKTPFDEIVVSFESINKSLRTLQKEGKTASEQLQLLSGIGPELQKFIDPKQASLLDSYREADSVVQSLKGKESELTTLQKEKYLAAKNTLAENEKNLPVLQAALQKAEEENKLRQASASLAKAQASFLQAQLSKYSQFLNSGAAGVRVQLDTQKRINSLNVVALEAQKAIIDTMITQQNLKLQDLNRELELLKAKKESLLLDQNKTLELAKQFQLSVNIANAPLKVGPLATGYVPMTIEQETQASKAIINAKETLENNKAINQLEESIKSLENSLRLAKLQSQALGISIAAVRVTELSSNQANKKALLADAQAAYEITQQQLATMESRKDVNLANQRLTGVMLGEADTLAEKLRLANSEYKYAKEIIEKTADSQVILNNAQIAFAQAMKSSATPDQKRAIEENIGVLRKTNQSIEEQKNLKLNQLTTEKEINTILSTNLETEEKRLQAAKSILDYRQKELEVTQEMNAAEYSFYKTKQATLNEVTGFKKDTTVEDAEEAAKIARESLTLRIATIRQEYALLEEQRRVQAENFRTAASAMQDSDPNKAKTLELSVQADSAANSIATAKMAAVTAATTAVEQSELEASKARILQYTNILLENFKKLGPDGEAASAIFLGMTTITNSVEQAFKRMGEAGNDTKEQIAAIAGSATETLGAVISMLSGITNAKIAAVEREIAAEEKRDGKSAASVAKLDALEKKKDSIARKSFNTNKKLMMAQAVMATAAGIANALASAPAPANVILAGIIGAMGAAQLAIISGTQYESSYSAKTASVPSSLSIGKRDNSVDLYKGSNANAGGEVGYLRGSEGTGSNASNYRTVGSAYGGDLMRGYGNRGFVVGEKGPEVITPETPITVTPANYTSTSPSISASISIQALDSQGVQDVLVAQKGNIIKMLREAANASGKTFMEDVNVNVYTRPQVNRL